MTIKNCKKISKTGAYFKTRQRLYTHEQPIYNMNCKGQNKNNTACKCTTSNKSGYCFRHLKQAPPALEDNFEPEIVKKVSTVCKGTTTRGKSPCKAKTIHESGYCPSHREMVEKIVKPVIVCKSKTSKGEDCKFKTTNESGYCFRHSEVFNKPRKIFTDEVYSRQCKSKTVKGDYCKSKTTHDSGYCTKHREIANKTNEDTEEDEDTKEEEDIVDDTLCGALTKKGTDCKSPATASGFCSRHTKK
jgi:hypothetical protein